MTEKIKIFIGADYRGFKLKSELLPYLTSCHDFIELEDVGVFDDEVSDFNDPAIAVAKKVKQNPGSFGLLICDSAHGVCMQANRFKQIRAINASSPESAKLGREHDNANVLCLSAGMIGAEESKHIIYMFFHTKFNDLERRVKRLKKLDKENYD